MGSCSIGYDSFHEPVWIYCEYVKGTGEQIFRIFDRESGEESDEMRILSSGSRRRSDRRRKAEVKVLKSADRWYGVTYKEDKETVVNAIRSMKEEGIYPKNLWK